MKSVGKSVYLLLSLFMLFAAVPTFGQKAFVIPVETEINFSAFHHFKKGLNQARANGAELIIVKLNTFGGAVDAADSIRTALMKERIPTVAFVDVNAASAGALIALACDSVYMSPGSSMGSATVVNGSGEPMPEKYQSYMSTMMRATAEHHGRVSDGDSTEWRRNPEIAASMVNPEVSVSLTASQALECGYAEGIAPNIESVLADLQMSGATVEYYNSTVADDILGFLTNAAVRAILIMLIVGGIYFEMYTPGMGFAAAVSLVASVLYFLPMFVGGGMPAWVLIAFIAGAVLIALEVFVIPGFGVCGIGGIISIVVSLMGAMLNSDAVSGVDMHSVGKSFATVGAGCVLAFVAIWYLTSSKGPKWVRKHSELMTELRADDGFIGVDMGPVKYVGQIAVTATEMRPAGKIKIGQSVFDAVSVGPFISIHKAVKVIKYENAQLYVEPEEDEK